MPGRPTNNPDDYVAVGGQTAKDTEATTFFFLKHREGSGFETDTTFTREREGGDGQEIGLSYKSRITQDGALNALARPEWSARVLAGVMGKDVATFAVATNSGLHDHFISPVGSIPYLTVEQRVDTAVERVSNTKINEVTVSFEAGKAVMIEAPALAAGTAHAGLAAQSPTREANRPFYYPGASVVLGGAYASGARLTKGSVKLTRGVDDDIQTNTLFREDLVELAQDTDVDLTLKYENAALWRQASYNGGSLVTADIATSSVSLVSAQGSFSFQLDVPVFEVTNARVTKLDPDGKTMYVDVAGVTVKALTGGTHAVWARIRNTASSPHAGASIAW